MILPYEGLVAAILLAGIGAVVGTFGATTWFDGVCPRWLGISLLVVAFLCVLPLLSRIAVAAILS